MQLSYGAKDALLIGQPVYDTIRGFVYSRACESASIDFGLAVGAGSADTQCVVGGSTLLGVALRNPANPMDSDNDGQYIQYQTVDVIDQDFVCVNTASTSGAYGDPVSYNTTTGAVVIGAPGAGENMLGWLAQTVTAAGKIRIFVDSRSEATPTIGGVELDLSSLADDCVLRYNAANTAFECEATDDVDLDAKSLDGVDVDVSALADDYVLRYNLANTALEFEATDGVDLDAASIQGVTVDDTDIADGKVLKYQSGSGNIEYEDDLTS